MEKIKYDQDKMIALLAKEMAGVLTEEEKEILRGWRELSEENEALYHRLRRGEQLKADYQRYYAIDGEQARTKVERRLVAGVQKNRRIRAIGWAAGIALLLGSAWMVLNRSDRPLQKPEPISIIQYNTPTLQLADGRTISLDESGFTSFLQAEAMVTQEARAVVYNKQTEEAVGQEKPVINTVRTPRGAEFKVVLEDGTEVWLNAESEIHFPVVFSGDSREVTASGEIYFKVAPDARRPFRVKTDRQTIEVLGTEFNLEAYAEGRYFTTLVNGRVKVFSSFGEAILEPGMQSVVSITDEIITTRKVEVDNIVSWRNGMFVLEGRNIEDIMSMLGRWYDFEVVYEKEAVKRGLFWGAIPRYKSLDQVLDILSRTNEVKFQRKEKKIIVTQ